MPDKSVPYSGLLYQHRQDRGHNHRQNKHNYNKAGNPAVSSGIKKIKHTDHLMILKFKTETDKTNRYSCYMLRAAICSRKDLLMRFPIPVFLIALIILCSILAWKRQKQTRAQEELNEAFLERERLANATRRQDISGLAYLPFDIHAIPDAPVSDPVLADCFEKMASLQDQKILNLSAYSNTDLKLMYGPANLNDLTLFDENYHLLSASLLSYAEKLAELGYEDSAVKTLEYAMSLSVDSSRIYLMLADLYEKQAAPEKIQDIRNALDSMDEPFRSRVLAKLPSGHTAG